MLTTWGRAIATTGWRIDELQRCRLGGPTTRPTTTDVNPDRHISEEGIRSFFLLLGPRT